MASRENAIKNNLNDRARKVGQFDELTTQDIDAVIAFYDYSCLNCGKKPSSSIDHVKPLIAGGSNTRDNLQLLCVECNKAKQDEETDYRNGKVVPADFVAPSAQNKETYKKHDWDALRFEYETNETLSLRDLAKKHNIFPTLLLKRSAAEGWHKSKQKFGIELVSTVENEVKQAVAKQSVERELSARGLLFDVIEEAVEQWQAKPRASLGDLAQLLKLGMAAQGETTDRTNVNVSESVDTDEIHARINRLFDAGEEGRTYTPVGDGGEEFGAGRSD